VEINGDTLKVTVPDGTTATLFPGTPSERTLGAGQWTLNVFVKPSAEGKSRSVCTMPRRENDGFEETNIKR